MRKKENSKESGKDSATITTSRREKISEKTKEKSVPQRTNKGTEILRTSFEGERINGSERTRYSDNELHEFKDLILTKLEDAKKEAQTLQDMLKRAHDNGTDDTARTFKNLEDGSDTLAKEELGQLVSRQQKFIEQLESALIRIETKTYGVCHITGKLIPKERLRIVPHTTQTIEAKLSVEK